MELWILATLAAAVFQTARFMLQKILSNSRLSAAGATWARFIYSAPIILSAAALYLFLTEQGLPVITGKFCFFAALGGGAQVIATLFVILLFKSRNFAVGITFKKTEVIQTAFLGFLVLGDRTSSGAAVAILLGLVAVLVLSKSPGSEGAWWQHLATRASMLGLGSGALFAVSAVLYRGATLSLSSEDPILRTIVTLSVVATLQAVGMGLWFLWRDRKEIAAVWAARKQATFVGLTSMGGSFCWFLAFTLQNAAYVKALGQVELLLSILASALFFHERITLRELSGIALLCASILLLVTTF